MNNRIGFFWVVANTIGAAFGWFVYVNLVNKIDLPTIFNFPSPLHKNVYEFSVIFGTTMGLTQWVVLSRLVKPAEWILATVGGWVIGLTASFIIFMIFYFFLNPIIPILGYPISGAVLGVIIGVFQWLIFYTQVTQRAHPWIKANIWAFSIGFFLILKAMYHIDSNDLNPETTKFFLMTLFGLIYGVITSNALVKLRKD